MTAQPYLIVDAHTGAGHVDTPQYQAFLAWLRSESINPERCKQIEVYDAPRPYAVVTLYDVDANGTRTETVALSSLPPTPVPA